MNLKKLGIFSTFQQKMRYLQTRQNVIATNIANANTPNFKAKDVKEPSFDSHMQQQRLTMTMHVNDDQHITPATYGSRSAGQFQAYEDHDIQEYSPDGNSVNLEEQLLKQSDISSNYSKVTKLYKKHFDLIKTVFGGGTGS